VITRKTLIAAALATFAALAAPLAHSQQAPIHIKLSHVVSPETAKGKAVLRFKELAEKYSGGRVKVDVFANSTLYKDKEEIEALQLGAVQMLIPAVAKFAPLGVTDFDAFDLPYLFPTLDSLHKVTQGPIGK
jgi:C4-dicarboxylate-binding protein DctP